MTRFKDRRLQEVYDLFRQPNPPTMRDGLQTAYRRGLAGICQPERTSLTYAAWAAGRDTARRPVKCLNQAAREAGWIVAFCPCAKCRAAR